MADKDVRYRLSLIDMFTPKIKGAIAETNKLDKSVSGLGSKLKGAFAGIAAGFAVNDIVQTTANYESLTNAIKAGSVSNAEGEKSIKFINDEVGRLGLNLEGAMKGFKTFQGSIMGTALDGEVGRKIFSQVSEAVAAMGLSADDAEGVFLAMGQMVSKGSVQAEELRGQLGERLPGAFRLAAQAMGVTTAELGKMMQRGEVTAEQLLPKLGNVLHDTFGVKGANASKSLRGQLNLASNAFTQLKVDLGTALLPVILKVLSVFQKLVDVLKSVISFIKEHRVAISFLVGAMGGLIAAYTTFELIQKTVWLVNGIKAIYNLWQMAAALGGTTLAQWALNTATAFFSGLTGTGIFTIAAAGAAALAVGLWAAKSAQDGLNESAKAMNPMGEGIVNPMAQATKSKDAPKDTSKTKAKGQGTTVSAVEARQSNNFNITINKLVEKLEFNTTNLKDSGTKVKEEVTKALISAVNDFQIMATK